MLGFSPSFLRKFDNVKNCSLRDVSSRRRSKSEKEKVFYGIGGFPDFCVMSKDFEGDRPMKEKAYGAVEVKYIGSGMSKRDLLQLHCHILWFNKVLYTNGLDWKYYNYQTTHSEDVDALDGLQTKIYDLRGNKSYKWESNDLKLLNPLKELKPEWECIIGEQSGGMVNWDKDGWDELQVLLSHVNWM